MTKQINILSTKKLLPNQKQQLVDANFTVLEEDFIETTIKNFELSKVNNNLIFTSQNAVQSILQHPKCEDLKSKDVFSIGMKTKDLLTENGFNVVAYTGYAADLAEIISLIYSEESFTFFSGNLRRDVLPNTLKENEITFNEIEVYETKITSKKITKKLDGILFFSPSAVESYFKMNTIKDETCFCIGETTAEALENKKVKTIVIADKPSVENVIAEVVEYYNN
ncbi:uroporphyrinogen-III synthase [Flavobacterium aquatile]|uniref:Uroporphyrinogen III synthase n=1 Tax=Flavobacterium aquatile LMG 4008 = ATCC 11947 TaxID=1453498 RepID=A0A095SW66_9FLAO|nr:uroporphyrinogen-III synthase [Flavobacterium aquatile]KGD68842.1 uroporphyrinogen III synthase [Flavobacterium aquatile LMG 4008 = ATCC 11947]OXA69357.1 uroporphyrinogen III synthase [Flavobacterium aquatile LMG 4008 = ATCC 11947]GEC79330.1 uroporphyrinogen III methyltransferase [Flavobacterium aquatile]